MAIQDARFDVLGQLLFDLASEDASRIICYCEFEPGVIGPAVFYERDGVVFSEWSSDALMEELCRLQDLFGEEVRAMLFDMRGAKFTTEFIYADRFDDMATIEARQDQVLIKCFGHTETVNPPWPSETSH